MAADHSRVVDSDQSISMVAWRTLAILVILYFLSLLDRQILSLLVISIQSDLHLSDTQLGVIQGLAFSLFYSVMGVVLALAVDVYSRRWMVFFGVIIWSLSTISCGFAHSFLGLFSARLGVGFGEAVLAPAAAALIGNLFPRGRLSLANGIYYASTNLGGLAAFSLGGILITYLGIHKGFSAPGIGHLKPWQGAFFFTGVIGLPLSFLAFLIWDPQKSRNKKSHNKSFELEHLETFSAFVRRRGALWAYHSFGFTFLSMCAYAAISWTPTYLARAFNASHTVIGLVMGLSFGLCGGTAGIFWGWVIDRLYRRGMTDAHYRVYLFLVPIGVPIAIAAFTATNLTLSSILICLTWLAMFGLGPLLAALLIITPWHLRARVSAGVTLTVGVLSIGLTPFLIGVITDHVFHNPAKVGWSIASFITLFGTLGFCTLAFARPRLAAAIREEQLLSIS